MKPAFDLLACPPPGSPRMTGGGRRAAGRGGSGPPATSLACRCSRRPRSGPPGAALWRGVPPSATGFWSAVLWPERRRLCPGAHPPPALPPSPLFLLLFSPLLVFLPLLFLCPRCGWGPLQRRPDSELTGVPFVEGIPSAPCQTFSRGASLQP